MSRPIEIENRFFKECSVVILPTKSEGVLLKGVYPPKKEPLELLPTNDTEWLKFGKSQELYITSDDGIRIGDLVICKKYIGRVDRFLDKNHLVIDKWLNIEGGGTPLIINCKKVLATTDESIGYTNKQISPVPNFCTYPKPSHKFIKAFCEQGGIGHVLVEYTKINRCCGRCDGVNDLCWVDQQCDNHNITDCSKCFPPKGDIIKLKTDSHNNITIKPVKNDWTREEHISDIKRLIQLYETTYLDGNIEDWIKKNLNHEKIKNI